MSRQQNSAFGDFPVVEVKPQRKLLQYGVRQFVWDVEPNLPVKQAFREALGPDAPQDMVIVAGGSAVDPETPIGNIHEKTIHALKRAGEKG